jgi:hypothetical protein
MRSVWLIIFRQTVFSGQCETFQVKASQVSGMLISSIGCISSYPFWLWWPLSCPPLTGIQIKEYVVFCCIKPFKLGSYLPSLLVVCPRSTTTDKNWKISKIRRLRQNDLLQKQKQKMLEYLSKNENNLFSGILERLVS